jgi:hypothetical protein
MTDKGNNINTINTINEYANAIDAIRDYKTNGPFCPNFHTRKAADEFGDWLDTILPKPTDEEIKRVLELAEYEYENRFTDIDSVPLYECRECTDEEKCIRCDPTNKVTIEEVQERLRKQILKKHKY